MKLQKLLTPLFLLFALHAAAQNDSLRLLFIGNSYTYYHTMPQSVQRIAASIGRPIAFAQFTPGGQRLTGHLLNEELLDTIRRAKWDFVVLQEQSELPSLPYDIVERETFAPIRTIDSLVHAANADARVVLYMTWGRRDGNGRTAGRYPLTATYEGMQASLTANYIAMACRIGAMCAPVGVAWERVRRERPDIELYEDDKTHPSAAGSYLVANIFVALVTGEPYKSEVWEGLKPKTAQYLQSVAQQTVLENRALTNSTGRDTTPLPPIKIVSNDKKWPMTWSR